MGFGECSLSFCRRLDCTADVKGELEAAKLLQRWRRWPSFQFDGLAVPRHMDPYDPSNAVAGLCESYVSLDLN